MYMVFVCIHSYNLVTMSIGYIEYLLFNIISDRTFK